MHTNVSYVVGGNPTYPLFLTLNFNQPPQVPVGFEIALCYALAHQFDCTIVVSDFSDSAGGLLAIQPTGQVATCVLDDEEPDQPYYRPAPGPLGTYQQVIEQLRVAAQQDGRSTE